VFQPAKLGGTDDDSWQNQKSECDILFHFMTQPNRQKQLQLQVEAASLSDMWCVKLVAHRKHVRSDQMSSSIHGKCQAESTSDAGRDSQPQPQQRTNVSPHTTRNIKFTTKIEHVRHWQTTSRVWIYAVHTRISSFHLSLLQNERLQSTQTHNPSMQTATDKPGHRTWPNNSPG